MITVQLKAKHYYLVCDILFNIITSSSFKTLEKIKTACNGVQDEDLVSVEIEKEKLVFVFRILTSKPEGQFNMINTEMMVLLIAQIQQGISQNNQEWIELYQDITAIREANWSVVTNMITSGKSQLF